jgi:hypothetical protein
MPSPPSSCGPLKRAASASIGNPKVHLNVSESAIVRAHLGISSSGTSLPDSSSSRVNVSGLVSFEWIHPATVGLYDSDNPTLWL